MANTADTTEENLAGQTENDGNNDVKVKKSSQKQSFRLVKVVKKENPVLFWAVVMCLLLSLGGFGYKMIYTIHKYQAYRKAADKKNESKKDNEEFNQTDEIEHIDFEGIFSAALGILIGIIITASVERRHGAVEQRHDEHNQALEKATTQIKTGVDEINRLVSMLGMLMPQTDLEERLKAIADIIRITKENPGNNLYILNYNTSFGLLQSHNLNILLEASIKNKHALLPKTWSEYHKYFYEKYYEEQKKIFNKLLGIEDGRVNFALLRTSNYKDLLSDLFLKKGHLHTIKPYYFGQDDPPQFKQNSDEGDAYTISFDDKSELDKMASLSNEDQQAELKEKLINRLLYDNESNIKKLNEHYKEHIAYLDHDDFVPIPFQFFLTAPQENGDNGVQQCLLIFTNILSSHHHPSQTTSFVSRNHEIIQTLKNIHDTIITNCREKEEHERKARQFFNCADDRKPEFILIQIPGPTSNEKTSLSYLADYTAYSDLKKLLSKHQIADTTLVHLEPTDTASKKKLKEIMQGRGTYIVIGLFDNNLTATLKVNENTGSFFDFHRTPIDSQHGGVKGDKIKFKDEKICIYLDKDNHLCEKREGGTPKEISKDDIEIADLALLVKMKVGESTVILCGGLSGLGTGIIGRHIREHFEELESPDILESEEFAIVFNIKLPDGDMEFNPNPTPEQDNNIKKIVTIKEKYTKGRLTPAVV